MGTREGARVGGFEPGEPLLVLLVLVLGRRELSLSLAAQPVELLAQRHSVELFEPLRKGFRQLYAPADLYRQTGVVLGGLALSTVFTLFVIPALLLFFVGMEKVGSGKKTGGEHAAQGGDA